MKVASLVVVCLVSLAGAELTCEDCSLLSEALMEGFSSSLDDQVDLFLEEACVNAPDPDGCREFIPTFWNVMGGYLFGPGGYLDAKYFCNGICEKSQDLKELSCDDCGAKVNDSMDNMAKDDVIAAIAEGLHMVCPEISDLISAEDCVQLVDYLMPIALTSLSTFDRSWVDKFCSEDMSCV